MSQVIVEVVEFVDECPERAYVVSTDEAATEAAYAEAVRSLPRVFYSEFFRDGGYDEASVDTYGVRVLLVEDGKTVKTSDVFEKMNEQYDGRAMWLDGEAERMMEETGSDDTGWKWAKAFDAERGWEVEAMQDAAGNRVLFNNDRGYLAETADGEARWFSGEDGVADAVRWIKSR